MELGHVKLRPQGVNILHGGKKCLLIVKLHSS